MARGQRSNQSSSQPFVYLAQGGRVTKRILLKKPNVSFSLSEQEAPWHYPPGSFLHQVGQSFVQENGVYFLYLDKSRYSLNFKILIITDRLIFHVRIASNNT